MSTRCPAVLHIRTTQHRCLLGAGHNEHDLDDPHESATGYRWTSAGHILTRPKGYRSQQRKRARAERDPRIVRAAMWAEWFAATEQHRALQDLTPPPIDEWVAEWMIQVGPDGPGRGPGGLGSFIGRRLQPYLDRVLPGS